MVTLFITFISPYKTPDFQKCSKLHHTLPISSNPVNSYDSGGVILVSISALGNEKWNLPFYLSTCFFSESLRRIRTYNMSLVRYFQGEDSAVGIVRNGSVGMELFKKQV